MASSLWRHADFMRLWIGQSVSQFGNQFTALAVQIIAATSLGATPANMGVLAALGTLPFLLFGLPVGVWVDRHRRRPILILGDLGRGVIVAAIAALAFTRLLQMIHLYVLAFATGLLTVFFDVAYQAYLPALVEREQIVEGNSKLETTTATAQVAGPTLAGPVIQFVSAAAAMVLDAFSFFFSAGMMARIRKPEEAPDPKDRDSVLSDIREGLRVVFRDRRLWTIAGCTGTSNFFSAALFAEIVLFAVRFLDMKPVAIGVATGVGALGAVAGAVTASRITGRLGVGRVIFLGSLLFAGGPLLLFLATPATGLVVLSAALFGGALGSLWYNINQVSLRQSIVSLRLQGRLNATMRFLVWGTQPVGALVGGALGEAFGLRPTVLLAAVGGVVAILWIAVSPVVRIREIPQAEG